MSAKKKATTKYETVKPAPSKTGILGQTYNLALFVTYAKPINCNISI